MLQRKSLTWFLIISFAISWPLFLTPLLLPDLEPATQQMTFTGLWVLAMWGPGIAAIDQACVGLQPGSGPENEQRMRLRAVPFTNNYIAQTHGDEGMFATLFFGVLNPATGKMCYINGGHEPLYVVSSEGIKTNLRPTGPALGMMPNSAFDIQHIQLEPGDVLVGYTDGVTEARSPADELFTRSRLLSLFEQPSPTASELLERIKTTLFKFIDVAPRNDDVTMLAIQRASLMDQ